MKNNYYYLPKKYFKKHDYCVFVINQIEDLILNKKFKELSYQSFDFPPEFIDLINSSDKHILDLLEDNNYKVELMTIVRNQVILGLLRETCYFIQEALAASLKMRMTVCFTLFRKPFLEILIILMRILNEDDFVIKFNYLDKFDPIKTTPHTKINLLTTSNEWLDNKYDVEELNDLIFNKDSEESLFTLTNNAIHLFTDRNKSETGKQNLNFIFSNQEDIESQWEYIYDVIPMTLTFLADIIEVLVYKSITVEEKVIYKRVKERETIRKKYNIT